MGFTLDMPDEVAINEQVKQELATLPERKEEIAVVAGKNADAFLNFIEKTSLNLKIFTRSLSVSERYTKHISANTPML